MSKNCKNMLIMKCKLSADNSNRIIIAKNLDTKSFGKRSQGCVRRTSECLTLEHSEMIVIDYPDIQQIKPSHRPLCTTANIDRLLAVEPQDDIRMRRMNSDNVIEQLPPDSGGISQLVLRNDQPFQRGGDQYFKRSSRASDTSSAYSGSDMMQSSIDDPENPDIDLSGLMESMVDSDEEDGNESVDSLPIRDAVRDCLEKEAVHRTEDDIETLLEFMQHFRAFSNMTLATRRALCAVMVFAVVEKANTIVMKDGEELDSWSVILNGEVEINYVDAPPQRLHMGDSFGISPTMAKLYHHGVMQTLVDDCQFVCIAQTDYYSILHQGEENTKKHEEKGQVVMLTEHRELDGGTRSGNIVIRGTADRLMQHLVEDHSAIDPTYVEDFLLTCRTFLDNPLILANKLLNWFDEPMLRSKVTRVVLLWVNNHFNDFETDPAMCEFLEHFEHLLEREPSALAERMMGQLRLLNIACAAKARTRTVTLTRATREEILHFSILGGLERGHGIFITKVEKGSKAYEAGLKRGDQILEVNGNNFSHISHNRALEILRGTTHLSVTVKSNLHEFKEMLHASEKTTPRKLKQDPFIGPPKQRLSAPDLEHSVPIITSNITKEKKEKKEKGFMFTNKTKLKKTLMKINILPKNLGSENTSNINHSDESLYTNSKPSRKSSTSSNSSSNTGGGMTNHLSASNPDLSSFLFENMSSDYPEHVVKVFRADQSFKFLLIHKETTAKEVVMLALQEFSITESSCNFSLCEVTVENDKLVKQKRLPDQLQNLPDRLNLNARYYLKNNMSTETLVPEETMGDMIKESQINILQLNTAEVASQLTLEDFKVFREIEPTEYIDDLYNLKSKYGTPALEKFSELVNKEMFWVVTEVCNEQNLVKRMKLIKHFIKIAKHCKDCKNFNSMFAIISGLGHGSVTRLRNTWERLPRRYTKLFDDLQDLMDPSRNMAKYRNLIMSDHVQSPMLPFFPVVKKDLTFIELGNDSEVEGLINFEKLRMIAKEIRHICNMSSARYDVSNMFLGTSSMYSSSSLVSGVATLKRTKIRRGSTVPNPKKMYEEAQMVRRVKSYLSNIVVIDDEERLKDHSNICEVPARRRDPSPCVNTGSPNMTPEEKRHVNLGPKFGTASPERVRKLMALSDKVRPHNPKIPVPTAPSPVNGRRHGSPRNKRPLPVILSVESSSVGSISRKPSRTGSINSTNSDSPTSSINSYQHLYSSETDSGHNSVISSNFDSHSSSSVGSCCNSPPVLRKSSHPGAHYHPHHPHIHSGTQSLHLPGPRPPLPSYQTVMQNAASHSIPHVSGSYSHCGGRRPPLPDYQAAAHMATLARQKQLYHMERANAGYYQEGDYDIPVGDGCGNDEEQVSAV
ncbi:hypothetical protein SNE40_005425 [Patella caerulea]|uniref:Rap guanine nucleotide exchange factor 2 n=1 Tax=Patella caerulea TaxID=87958 RepID=A0AAN8QBE4_PATCE